MAPRLREGAARLSGRRGGAAAHLPAPVGSVGPARAAQPGAAGERGRSRLPRPQLQAGSVGLTGSQRAPEAAASPRPALDRARAPERPRGEAREGGVDAGTRRPQRRAEAPAGAGRGPGPGPGRARVPRAAARVLAAGSRAPASARGTLAGEAPARYGPLSPLAVRQAWVGPGSAGSVGRGERCRPAGSSLSLRRASGKPWVGAWLRVLSGKPM